ncbi:MAG TPA: glycosyltransferase family 39 protein, partial [Bacteroidota bacterium]|nr:glycosyltransferase family 39 protein [Bacteroidota bacterium]
RQILDRGVFEDSNGDRAVRAPLFPVVLAGLIALVGDRLIVLHLAGCLLGVVEVWLVYLLAMRLWADYRGALSAAAIAALYPGLIIYSTLLQTETLYGVFFLFAILSSYTVSKSLRIPGAILCGICCGLAALTRAVFAGFIPILVLIILWQQRDRMRRALPAALVVLASAILTVAPWSLRNVALFGKVIPLASGGGSSLLTGNNPYAVGTYRVREGFDEWFRREAAERGVSDVSRLDESERSGLSAEIAVGYMTSHPIETILLSCKKTYIFWVYPILHTDSWPPGQAVAVGADALLLILSAFGVIGMWFLRARLVTLYASIGFFWLVQALLHSESRFRLPLIPLLAVLAGWGVIVLWRRRRLSALLSRTGTRIALAGSLACIFLLYAMTGILFLMGIVR